jgi:hypothetical protein
MAFVDMYWRLHGSIPKIPLDYCKILVNDAWKDVRKRSLWSFQLFEGNWVSPGAITTGTATTVIGQNTVVLDAVAAAAVEAQVLGPPTPIIDRQFRVGIGTIYNIWNWQYNVPVAGEGTLTLDRPYAEASGSGIGFEIIQCYYPAPYIDFKAWISVRDMTNFIDLFVNQRTRSQLDSQDPQRSWYYFPTDVVPYMRNQNPTSPWYQFPMFELWGAPLYQLPYQIYGVRQGPELVNDSDTLPPSIGEDCVSALARVYGYEWAEANKGDNPRNAGPDYRFLCGLARKEYEDMYKQYRKDDISVCNNFFFVRRLGLYGKFFAYYNSIGGTAYPGVAITG